MIQNVKKTFFSCFQAKGSPGGNDLIHRSFQEGRSGHDVLFGWTSGSAWAGGGRSDRILMLIYLPS